MTQEELNALANEFYDYLANQKDFYEVWPSEDDTICVDISWGDWKHDHLRLDHIAKDFFREKGYDILNMDTEVTDEDGSDTYSATHSYRLRKHVEESKVEEDLKDRVYYGTSGEFLRKYGLDKYFEFDGCDLVDKKDYSTTIINFGRNGKSEETLLKEIQEYYPKIFKKLGLSKYLNKDESLEEDVELFKKYGANPSKSSRGWDAGDLHKYEDGLVLSYSSKKDAEEAANKLKQDGFKISSIDNDNIQSNGKGLEWNIYCFKESKDALKEESSSKGNRIASTVAKFFKGQSGPMGDDDPSVSDNTLEFWTQAGTSTYTFSDDGSIYAESDYDAETAYNDGGGWEGFYDEDDLDVDADDYEDEDEYLDALNDAGLEKFIREQGEDYEPKTYKSIEELCNSEDGWFSGLSKSQATSLIKKVNSILNSQEESCKKQVKESWEGESIIDDLIERAQSMYDEGGYGDIDECVAQAIDEGLIYSDDILELAKHYGTLPDDSDLIAEFYDELSSDVYSGIEEHEESDEDDFEDDSLEDEE